MTGLEIFLAIVCLIEFFYICRLRRVVLFAIEVLTKYRAALTQDEVVENESKTH